MSDKIANPFVCQGYESPRYFCDREEETKNILNTLYNGRNITLISPRRLGKTGLIWNAFHHIQTENKDAPCLHVDIFPTQSQHEFVDMLGSAVLNNALSRGKAFGKKVMKFLGALRPVVGIDHMTGFPNVTLNTDPAQAEMSLKSIFSLLGNLEREVFVAIDEFQQINEYPEGGTEALLRSHIQFLRNVHFIFSGSKQHLMSEMFLSPKRPFYQSTDILNLMPLDEEVYYGFANAFFKGKGGHLDRDFFHELYSTFDGYTWYIQSVLNRLYEGGKKADSVELLRGTILSVTESKAPQYEYLTQMLTGNQFAVLRAIAKKGVAKEPTGKEFLKKYKLPSSSSVKTALEMLVDKELVYRLPVGYIVYDRFLGIWLRRL